MSNKHKRWLGLAILVLIGWVLVNGPVNADDLPVGTGKLSGFGTLGLSSADNPDVGVITGYDQVRPVKNQISPNLDTDFGLQYEWRFLEKTSAMVQMVSRAGRDYQAQVRMAYVAQDLDHGFGLRLGRIRSPFFMDSDVEEIGYAYLMARPPMPLYSYVNNVPSIDGGDIRWHGNWQGAAVLVQAYGGRYGSSMYMSTYGDQTVDEQFSGVGGLAVTMAWPNITVRASHTMVDRFNYRTAVVNQLNSGLGALAGGVSQVNQYVQSPVLAAQAQGINNLQNPYNGSPVYTSLSFDATEGDWRYMGEWTLFNSHAQAVGKYDGYQLTVGHADGDFTPYATLARLRRLDHGMDLSSLNQNAYDAAVPGLSAGLAAMQQSLATGNQLANISSDSISVGVRYDFRPNMDVKVQYDRLHFPSYSGGYASDGMLPVVPVINLFTVDLDFVF